MQFLKQSTASQSVLIGPFVDDADGTTAETGLTIANTDIRVSKNGGNIAAKNSGGGTHDELGFYTITLDATDTDTVGRLQLACKMAGALVVYHEFQVLEEAIHDALYAAGADAFDANARVKGVAGTLNTLDGLDTAQDSQHATTQSAIGNLNDPTAAAIRAEIDGNSTQLAAIVAAVAALNDIAAADVWAAATRTLTANTNLNDPTAAAIRAELDGNSTELAAIVSAIAGLNDISVADLLTTQMSESYSADGAAPSLAQALFLLIAFLTEKSVSGTTVTAKQLDGATTAATFTLDDDSAPTSISRSG